MKRFTVILVLLSMIIVSGLSYAQVEGNPNYSSRCEFVYPDYKFTAKLDGAVLEATDGLKATVEVSHGKHLLQAYKVKGMFTVELLSEERIDFPGGYIVRVTISDGELEVFEIVPIPGLNVDPVPVQQPTAQQSQTTTTTITASSTVTTTEGGTGNMLNMQVGANDNGASVSINMGGLNSSMSVSEQTTTTTTSTTTIEQSSPPAPQQEVVRFSKIILMSEEGMCDVYLDGVKKGELGIADIDELAKMTLFDLRPGNYLIKIEGFEVWYEGTISVGNGEEIKIRTEPNQFKIIARNQI